MSSSNPSLTSSAYSVVSNSNEDGKEKLPFDVRVKNAVHHGDWDHLKQLQRENSGFGEPNMRDIVWPFLLSPSVPLKRRRRDDSEILSEKVEVSQIKSKHDKDASWGSGSSSSGIGSGAEGEEPVVVSTSGLDSNIAPNSSRQRVGEELEEKRGGEIEENENKEEVDLLNVEHLPPHRDEGQVALDVNRSFISYPSGPSFNNNKKDVLKRDLQRVIIAVLRRHPSLNYFQGYHDIVSIILLTLSPSSDPSAFNDESSPANHLQPPRKDLTAVYKATEHITLHRIRDNLTKNLEPAMGYLRVMKKVVEAEDRQLGKAMQRVSPIPFFSLSWVLTLLSHDLTSLSLIQQVFDFLLLHNPITIAYLAAAIVIAKKDTLLPTRRDSHSDEDEMDEDEELEAAMMHSQMSKLPEIYDSSPQRESLSKDISGDVGPQQLPTPEPTPEPPDLTASGVAVGGLESMVSEDEKSVNSQPLTLEAQNTAPSGKEDNPTSPIHEGSSSQEQRGETIIDLSSLFERTLSLYERFPPNEDKIKLSEIMGSKSAVFTWRSGEEVGSYPSLSSWSQQKREGTTPPDTIPSLLLPKGDLTDSEAEDIVKQGVDIVHPAPPPFPEEDEEKDLGRRPRPWRRPIRPGDHRIRIGPFQVRVSTIVTVAVGIAGVALAFYASTTEGGDAGFWLDDQSGLPKLGRVLDWLAEGGGFAGRVGNGGLVWEWGE